MACKLSLAQLAFELGSLTQFEAVDARILKRLPATAGSGEFILDIHLRANAGITALFGPSGAGKSLTLNCLAGFARPDAGRIVVENAIFFDHDAGVHLPPQQRRCGYIFQDHALFPHMTVRQNLQFATGSSLARRRRINDLLSNFELIDLAERKPAQLSGGQRQRAALARALITEPRLILLDEPTRGLDIRLRAGFFGLLKHLNTLKIPIVLVTHDLSDCFDIADNVCLLDNGRILQSGTREGVLFKPATSSIAQSLGIFAVIPATITSLDPGRNTSRLQLLLTEISAAYLPGHLLGDRGFVCVPHSELRILARGIPARDNTLELRVRDVGTSPQGVRISFEPAESSLVATVSESEWVNLRGEERLSVQIPSRAVSFVGN